jgi:hypothetical protein
MRAVAPAVTVLSMATAEVNDLHAPLRQPLTQQHKLHLNQMLITAEQYSSGYGFAINSRGLEAVQGEPLW